MGQEGRYRQRACVAPAASPHGDRAVLPFAVPGDEHVGNLGPLGLPDLQADLLVAQVRFDANPGLGQDRKSTRLNSSHSQISYAVFCLKKKKKKTRIKMKYKRPSD